MPRVSQEVLNRALPKSPSQNSHVHGPTMQALRETGNSETTMNLFTGATN